MPNTPEYRTLALSGRILKALGVVGGIASTVSFCSGLSTTMATVRQIAQFSGALTQTVAGMRAPTSVTPSTMMTGAMSEQISHYAAFLALFVFVYGLGTAVQVIINRLSHEPAPADHPAAE